MESDPDSFSRRAWRRETSEASLPEVHRSISVPKTRSSWRKLLAFAGPGALVAVGYMDPGNWATDLQGGAQFGYTLLSVIMISNLVAMFLQYLCVKLGVASGRDLAQACRDHYSKPIVWFLWILAEIAMVSTDLAEVIGSGIALQLLFGIPLVVGCLITGFDVLVILFLQSKGFRYIEAMIIALIATIGICFAAEFVFSKPSLVGMLMGFVLSVDILRNSNMLYTAIGIFGATVMPHNLYMHSSIVQTRNFERTPEGKRDAIKYFSIDVIVALTIALFINAAILILAAAAFHWSGHQDVAQIQDAYKLLSPVLGVTAAGVVFAIGLLASGQQATFTGTLAGQIVMEGFLQFRIAPWLRRLITRLLAIAPAICVIGLYGESRATDLLVFSQVVLSVQLGFAVWPLLRFTGEKVKMGEFVNSRRTQIIGWILTFVIIILNAKVVFDSLAPDPVQKAFYHALGLPAPTS
ncbi:MAG: Nramp family divalent metal transporter [Verrucomicrobia bacterium]|nr:Nramp family divalent metal transporter [Verrucomicrobiota bacterium]